jgi:hypothetical protein
MKTLLSLGLSAAILLPSRVPAAEAIDDARVAAAGIHTISGKHLTLYTDTAGPEIDQLPEAFDQAFPQWCRYFGIKETAAADWRVTACLIKDQSRFAGTGLLPGNLPEFEHRGYTNPHGQRFWVFDQPSVYQRRELFLHEGTHAFMFRLLGGAGTPWYMEGMAEYLGTHRWQDGRLTLAYTPRSRGESLGWGRVPTIQRLAAEHRALRLKGVIEMSLDAFRNEESYPWCWAAVTLLDQHPRYQKRFRQAIRFVRRRDFNECFHRLFQKDWQDLCEEWQVMVAGMEYGYDVARAAIDFTPGKPLSADGAAVIVAADHGWQNSGVRLEAGAKYRLTAEGRYQVAKTPVIWWCEPNGVSIRYYRGRPLGMLLAAIRPDSGIAGKPPRPGQPAEEKLSAFLRPTPVGLRATLSPDESGTLFLKINHSAGELGENAGHLTVKVVQE